MTLLQRGGSTAAWLKHAVDLTGATKMEFELSVVKDGATSVLPEIAIVWQQDSSIEALGGPKLGGASGILAKFAVVFDFEEDSVQLYTSGPGLTALGATTATLLETASLETLSTATKKRIVVETEGGVGGLDVSVSSDGAELLKARVEGLAHQMGYFGVTSGADQIGTNSTVTLANIKIAKATPANAFVNISEHSTIPLLGSTNKRQVSGQLTLKMSDACSQPTTLVHYTNEETQLIQMSLLAVDGIAYPCAVSSVNDALAYEKLLFMVPDLTFKFSCAVSVNSVVQQNPTAKLKLVFATAKVLNLSGDVNIDLSVTLGVPKALKYVVLSDADLKTGQLKQVATIGSPYVIQLAARDKNFAPVSIYASDLALKITQDGFKRIATQTSLGFQFSQGVSFDCYLTDTGTPCATESFGQKASEFSLVLLPQQTGVLTLHSPFFSVYNPYIIVTDDDTGASDPTSLFLSTKNSYAKLESANEQIVAGSAIFVQIVPVSGANSLIGPSDFLVSCKLSDSFFTVVTGDGEEFRSAFQEIDMASLRLSALVNRAGTLTVHPRITCGSQAYQYPISCLAGITACQRVVKSGTAVQISVKVPRDYNTQKEVEALVSKLDLVQGADQIFQAGENLVLDLIMVDTYGNHVANYDFSNVTTSVKFVYGTKSMTLVKTVTPGRVHFAASSADNTIFRGLPPRTNFYRIQSLVSTISQTSSVDILNLKDPDYPMNVQISSDNLAMTKKLSQISFEPYMRIGETVEIQIIMLTDALKRIAVSASYLSITFYDTEWQTKCNSTVLEGLYPGEFIAQIKCTGLSKTSEELLEFMVWYANKTELSPERLAVKVLQQAPAQAAKDFYQYEGKILDLASTQHVLELKFGLLDNFANPLKSSLLTSLGSFNGTTALDVAYTLTAVDSSAVRKGQLQIADEALFAVRVQASGLLAGKYTLELHMASSSKTKVTFQITSSSTLISPSMSSAALTKKTTYAVGDQLEVVFKPKNALGQAISDLTKVKAQIYCRARNEKGNYIEMTTVVAKEAGSLSISSTTALAQSGNYSVHLQTFNTGVKTDAQSYVTVVDGLFVAVLADQAYLDQVTVYMKSGEDRWSELSSKQRNFYSEALHSSYLVFKVENPNGLQAFNVTDISLMDFSVAGSSFEKANFKQVADFVFAIKLPQTVYGKQTFTLSLTVAKGEAKRSFERQILTTDRLSQNPLEAVRIQAMIECPALINFQAGEFYNLTCFTNNVASVSLMSTASGAAAYTSSIKMLGPNFVQVLLFKTVATSAAENIFLKGASVVSIPISVTVNSGSIQTMQVLPVEWKSALTNQTEVTTQWLARIVLQDSFKNVVKVKADTYSEAYLATLLQVTHTDPSAMPVPISVQARDGDFLVNITSRSVGNMTISSPLLSNNSFTNQVVSMQTPASATSFARVDVQNLKAGDYLYIRVYLRDQFGNADLKALANVDSLGLKATVDKMEAGRSAMAASKFFAQKETDGTTSLLSRVKLTEAGYYRARVFLPGSETDLTCARCYFKVVADLSTLIGVRLRDFTGSESAQKARVLKDEDQPVMQLRFVDSLGNVQTDPSFVPNLSLTVIDALDDKLDILGHKPKLRKLDSYTYTLDFCTTDVGLDKKCLSGLSLGRLKLQMAGSTSALVTNLEFIAGTLGAASLTDASAFSKLNQLTTLQRDILERMVAQSNVALAIPAKKETQGMTTTQVGNQVTVRIKTLDATATVSPFTVTLSEFDSTAQLPVQKQTLALSLVGDTWQGAMSLDAQGMFMLQAVRTVNATQLPCLNACFFVIRDPKSGLVKPTKTYSGQLAQGVQQMLVFTHGSYEAGEELSLQSQTPSFTFNTTSVMVLESKEVFATIVVTKADANSLATIKLLSNLTEVTSKTLLVGPVGPRAFKFELLANSLVIAATSLGSTVTRLLAWQVPLYMQIKVDNGDDIVHAAETFNTTASFIVLTPRSKTQTLTVQFVATSSQIVLSVPATSAEPVNNNSYMTKDGTLIASVDQITRSGLYLHNQTTWYFKSVGPIVSTEINLIRYRQSVTRVGTSFANFRVNQTQPFMFRIAQDDLNGNRVVNSQAQFRVIVSGRSDVLTVKTLLDGTSLAVINPSGPYLKLPQGEHEVKVHALNSTGQIDRTDLLSLTIVDLTTQEIVLSEELTQTLSAVTTETIQGLRYQKMLRKDQVNFIVFKAVDQHGFLYLDDLLDTTVKTTYSTDFSLVYLTRFANDGAFRLVLLPRSLRQVSMGTIFVTFKGQKTTQTKDIVVEYKVQPSLEPLFAGIMFSQELTKTHVPQERLDLDFFLFNAASQTSKEKVMLQYDDEVIEMLRLYKNGELYACNCFQSVRSFQLSQPYTYKLPVYLGDEVSQTFELYLFNEYTERWLLLYSSTFNVVQPKKQLAASSQQVVVGEAASDSVTLSVTSFATGSGIRLGQNLQVNLLLTSGAECMQAPSQYDSNLDLELLLRLPDSGQTLDATVTKRTVDSGSAQCPQYVAVTLLVTDESLLGKQVEFWAVYKRTGATANLKLTVEESPIEFSKTEVVWLSRLTIPSIVKSAKTSEVFMYKLNFYDGLGRLKSLPQGTPIALLCESLDLTSAATYTVDESGTVTIVFKRPGSYFVKGYRIAEQDIYPNIANGPALFQVSQNQCPQVSVKGIENQLQAGQTNQVTIKCIDELGMTIAEQPEPEQVQVIYRLKQTSKKLQVGATPILDSPLIADVTKSQGLLQSSKQFNQVGTYNLQVQINNKAFDLTQALTVTANLCVANAPNVYLCPGTTICTSNYFNCPRISVSVCGLDPADGKRFTCTDTSTSCVANVTTDCCPALPDGTPQFYCPHTKACVTDKASCCSLDKATPIYCAATKTCVAHQYQCCSNLQSAGKPLVKCSFENKCVVTDDRASCFAAFKRECKDARYPYQCPTDGMCRRRAEDCPSPRVCPPGYTQCPDNTCIAGSDQFNQCSALSTCQSTLPAFNEQPSVQYIRCPDGKTCVTTFDDCPTQISCLTAGYVVCPDASCRATAYDCVQPPSTVQSVQTLRTCGPELIRCPNGACSATCERADEQAPKNCRAQGKVLCATTLDCANSYEECPLVTFCPYSRNITFSPGAYRCGDGPQVCVLDRTKCQTTSCRAAYAYFAPESTTMLPYAGFKPSELSPCADGRCMMEGYCMTPFQCSSSYIKAGGFGNFCVTSKSVAEVMLATAVQLNSQTCPPGFTLCLNGQCRASVYDCPQDTTCNPAKPVQCRDGQCVSSRDACELVDKAIFKNLATCYFKGLQLCNSDYLTCAVSQDQCPTLSTCPFGFIKCSESLCVNPTTQSCPIAASSDCQTATDGKIFFCRESQTCVASYASCPTIATCPSQRPVRCAADLSCRQSISLCPNVSGSDTAVSNYAVCDSSRPVKCEDGKCAVDRSSCANTLSAATQLCLKSKLNYFCFLTGQCVQTPGLCTQLTTAASPCPAGSSFDFTSNTCVTLALGADQACPGENEFVCQNGSCKSAPCDEWVKCPAGTQQCATTGSCVTDMTLCPSRTTACPFDKPIKCAYSAACVATNTDCPDAQTAQKDLQTICQSTYPGIAEFACQLEGNCKSQAAKCATEIQPNALSLFPNTIADSTQGLSPSTLYIPACPPSYPHKCDSGLCVKSALYCPSVTSRLQDLQRCNAFSISNVRNLQVPCADGSCVFSSDQCLPLYDCSLNPLNKIRCNDGTCRSQRSDCPQLLNSCPTTTPYRCRNGMCAVDSSSCLSNENGCSSQLPYRCETNGVCMKTADACYSPLQLMQQLSLIPPTGSTNFCSKQAQEMCYSGQGLMYCATKISSCYQSSNNCPVTAPVFCNGSCQSTAFNCVTLANDAPVIVALAPENPSKNDLVCPPSVPFRCSKLDFTDCRALPYTSYASLFDKACSTELEHISNIAEQHYMNACVNSITPFACGDGSCVATPGQCKTCHFCAALGQCVASKSDCLAMDKTEYLDLRRLMMQTCPRGAPYRCVTNGKCVQSALACDGQRTATKASIYNLTYTGGAMQSKCPYSSPVRCVDGACVTSYQACFTKIDRTSKAFQTPIAWAAVYDPKVTETCQVYCQDGSCRDRQENCPLILGCSDPLKPFRCRSGFCAQNALACSTLYDVDIEAERADIPSAICKALEGSTQDNYFRCEDGICRPGVLDAQTKLYQRSCLGYVGCGLAYPFQCPNGVCVVKQEECQNFSPTCKQVAGKPYQCKDLTCVASPQECAANPALIAPIVLEYSYNIVAPATIEFAFMDHVPIGRFVLPQDAITIPEGQIALNGGYQRLRIEPVPTETIKNVRNYVKGDFIQKLSAFFAVNVDTGLLPSADSLFAPTVRLVNLNSTQQSFAGGAKLEFYLPHAVYSNFNVTNDFCLARANSSDMWDCKSRQVSLLADGFWSFPVSETGIYSVVLNPDAVFVQPVEPPSDGGKDEKFYDKKITWIIVSAVLLAILIASFLVFCLCCRKKNKQAGVSQESREERPSRPQLSPDSVSDREERLLSRDGPQNQRAATRAENTAADESEAEESGQLSEVEQLQERFDQLMILKQEEINKLKEQLQLLRMEHQDRQRQLEEHAESENSDQSELKRYKMQLREKYRRQVMKIAEDAKHQIEIAKEEIQGVTATRRGERIEKFSVNNDDHFDNNSFDSDQQREIALLDQQWNDLVNEYIRDPSLMVSPPNEGLRTVLQFGTNSDEHKKSSALPEYSENLNLESPGNKRRKSIRSITSGETGMKRRGRQVTNESNEPIANYNSMYYYTDAKKETVVTARAEQTTDAVKRKKKRSRFDGKGIEGDYR